MTVALEPGPGEPYPPGDHQAIAEQFGVDAEQVVGWLGEGLPTLPDGRIDPMVCCNWLSWGRLERSPALARRWRRYLACFEPHRARRDERLVHRWARYHALYLPRPVTGLHWWLPDPIERGVQVVRVLERPSGPGLVAETSAGGTLLVGDAAEGTIAIGGSATIAVATWRAPAEADERRELGAIAEAVVAAFRYEYRRHRQDDPVLAAPTTGTCLDCALVLQRELRAAGWQCHLEGGIVARSDIANAHYWVVVELEGERLFPIDPSIPAIARMLDQDWRGWLQAYLGAIDARRITLSSRAGAWPGGDRRFVDPVPGEAWCDQGELWACQDWVCGRTLADFTTTSDA